MINWCIEKPNEGRRSIRTPAMKALEAYMYWSAARTGSDPGRH
jgi:thiosulfate dehydrogenase